MQMYFYGTFLVHMEIVDERIFERRESSKESILERVSVLGIAMGISVGNFQIWECPTLFGIGQRFVHRMEI